MRTLVIDTATAACSVALIEAGMVVARGHAIVGRGHAEQLVPMIASLPGGGLADRILVDCGPGSFTGVRVGIAAARGLALGWECPVAGYSSMALIAAAGLAHRPRPALGVVLEGGHGELFVQAFDAAMEAIAPLASLKPDTALAWLAGLPAIGNGAAALRAIDPDVDAQDALPDAADCLRLPPRLTALPARPIYGRAPDARIPAARAPA